MTDTTFGAATRTLGDYVNHDRVVVRFAALWLLCATCFTLAWYVAYQALPAGLLRGGSASLLPEYAGSLTAEFLTILAWNLGFGLVVVAANTFRSVRTPMGYLVVLVSWVQGAVVWGTDSLAISAGRLAPSLSVALGRSGLYELTAFVAIAVATRGVMLWHQPTTPRWSVEFDRVRSPRDWTLSRREAVALAGGLLLLAAANYREALMIRAAVG